MADRYWVGGAGTWDSTSTTHWSASSGGAAGASAPTLADNAIFDTLSNATLYTVTIGASAVAANCLDLSIAGPAVGNVTIAFGTGVINCYGSWLNAATGVAFTTNTGCAANFLATSTGKTITTNGVSVSGLPINLNSATGGWTLGSAFTTTNTFTVAQGSFSTSASNWGLTVGILNSTGTGVRSINLNASLVSCTGSSQITFTIPTNLTFNAGTSSIVCATNTSNFSGGGQTFYNVSYTNLSQLTATMSGANTFNNLTFPVKTFVGTATFTISSDQIVTGTLTMAGSTYNTRFLITSDTIGTPRTITAGAVSLSYVDFRDIVGAGTATWTGTSIGNCLGNTNITFTAAKTVYWNLAGTQLWSATAWAPSSGGTPAVANFPLAQDTAVFDDAGAVGTINSWFFNVGSVDMSLRTTTMSLIGATSVSVYGNWSNGTGTVITNTGIITFLGRSLQTITPAGITFTSGIAVTAFGGTVRILAALTTTSTTNLALNNGTLDLNNFKFTTVGLTSTNSNTRSIAFGTGDITLTGNAAIILSMALVTGFTYTGTPTINATYAGSTGTRTFSFGTSTGTELNALSINVTAGGDACTFANGTRINSVDFTGAYTGLATFGGGTFQCFGSLTLNSVMTITSGGIAFSSTSATPRTITSANQTMNFAVTFSGAGGTFVLQDNLTFGTAQTTTLTAGTLDLNNLTLTTGLFASSGTSVRTIAFGTGNITCTGVGATWNTATVTNLTTTGTPVVNVTSALSTTITVSAGAISEANSISFNFTNGTYLLSFLNITNYAAKNVNFTGFAGTWNATGNNVTVYGDLTLNSSMTLSTSTGNFVFGSTSATPRAITTAGQTMDFPPNFNGVGGTWALQDTMTLGSTRTMTLTNGTVQLKAGTTNTVGAIATSGTNQKFLQSTISGTSATLTDSSGTNSVSYLTIQDSAATGGAAFQAYAVNNNVNAGNNTGWLFGPNVANFFMIIM